MTHESYFAYLQSIRGRPDAIDKEKGRLDSLVGRISQTIKGKVTEKTAASLVWHLAMKEIERVAPLVGVPISDFAGHARHLRALAAAVPFTAPDAKDDPKTDELLEMCSDLWSAMFHREMIDDLRSNDVDEGIRQQTHIAAAMSLLEAVQGELVYVEQAEVRVLKQFRPFSESIVRPQLGLSVEEVVEAFRAIRQLVADRFNGGMSKREALVEKWHEYRRRARQGASDEALDRFVREDPEFERMGKAYCESIQIVSELLVFTPENIEPVIGARAHAFFDAFAFVPGEINGSYLTPFDADLVRARPFARCEGNRFLLFDLFYGSLAPLYRLPECFSSDVQKAKLTQQRDKSLEADSDGLLSAVVCPSVKAQSYYLPVGKDGSFAERDLLLYREGSLFLVESKAKAIRSVSEHRGNLKKIASDVKASIQSGYDQACTVESHIASNMEVKLYDSDKSDRAHFQLFPCHEIRETFVIVILDSYYGLIATDLAPWLNVNPRVGYPWVVDRDTLESVLLKLDTHERLSSFLRWRRQLHGRVFNEDEAVFAGFFLRHGPFAFPIEGHGTFLDPSYSDVFEAEWFRRKGLSVDWTEEMGSPVLASMRQEGNKLIHEIDGRIHDVIDLNSGHSTREIIEGKRRRFRTKSTNRVPQTAAKESKTKVGRNDPCVCGSGMKFKKCCLRRFSR